MFLFTLASLTATAGIFVFADGPAAYAILIFLLAAIFFVGGAIVGSIEKKKS